MFRTLMEILLAMIGILKHVNINLELVKICVKKKSAGSEYSWVLI